MIRGKKVQLRPVEESDYPLIHRWMNHPEVWRNMDYEQPFSLADVKDDVEDARRNGQPFTIVAEGRPVGRIGLNQFRRRDRICSFYMYLGEPASWGHGYGRDAAMALLTHAFDRMDLSRIELWALADNDRALALYRRCGFVEEARLPERSYKDGRFVDRVVMSVTREGFQPAWATWAAAAAPPGGLGD